MRRILWFILLFFPFAGAGFATVFGTVRGIVHDPQHRPVPNVTVTLKAQASSYIQTSETDANGEFHFDAIPLGEYRVTASAASFANAEQTIAVLSGTAPILHFELKLSAQAESITVSADAGPAQLESITPTTLVNRLEIRDTPGASRTNSLALITDFVPGSYVVHNQLHIDGFAVAFGLGGLVLVRYLPPGSRPALWRYVAAGVLLGVAAATKSPGLSTGFPSPTPISPATLVPSSIQKTLIPWKYNAEVTLLITATAPMAFSTSLRAQDLNATTKPSLSSPLEASIKRTINLISAATPIALRITPASAAIAPILACKLPPPP